MDLEEVLDRTIAAVARHKQGRLESIGAAIEGGQLLQEAKRRLQHGDWIPWLEKCGLNRMTANIWMRLAGLGLGPQEVLAQGGIKAALKEAQPSQAKSLREQLAGVNAELAAAKRVYYDKLDERKGLARKVKRLGLTRYGNRDKTGRPSGGCDHLHRSVRAANRCGECDQWESNLFATEDLGQTWRELSDTEWERVGFVFVPVGKGANGYDPDRRPAARAWPWQAGELREVGPL